LRSRANEGNAPKTVSIYTKKWLFWAGFCKFFKKAEQL